MHDCSCEWIHLLQNEILIEMQRLQLWMNSLTTERDFDRNARLQLWMDSLTTERDSDRNDCSCEWQNETDWNARLQLWMDSLTTERDSDRNARLQIVNGFTYYRTRIEMIQNEILIEMHDCSCEWIHLLQNEISDRNARLQLWMDSLTYRTRFW